MNPPERHDLPYGTLDFGARLFRPHRGQPVPLRDKEVRILEALVAKPGVTLSRRQLRRVAWDNPHRVALRQVDEAMGGLRGKIEEDPERPRLLLTIPGVKYRCARTEAVETAPEDVTVLVEVWPPTRDLDDVLSDGRLADKLLSGPGLVDGGAGWFLRVFRDVDAAVVWLQRTLARVWDAPWPDESTTPHPQTRRKAMWLRAAVSSGPLTRYSGVVAGEALTRADDVGRVAVRQGCRRIALRGSPGGVLLSRLWTPCCASSLVV